MPTIADLNKDIEAALADLKKAREVREGYLIARSPWAVGQKFTQKGHSYQAQRIEAHGKADKVVAWCYRFNANGKLGQRLLPVWSEDIA